jgi:hypothetical protein
MKAPVSRTILLSAAALLALSACGKKAPQTGDVGLPLSGNEVESAAGALKLDPGEWEMKVETLDVQASGVPQETVRGQIGNIQKFKVCVTDEQGTNPGQVFLKGMDEANCAASKMTVGDGKVDAVISCPVPNQPKGQMRTTLTGTYLPDSYGLDMTSVMEGLPNDVSVTVKSRNSGQRLGTCPPDSEGSNAAG